MKDHLKLHNVLCCRLDNMGDVLMSGPAMRALKETFQCKITLLTSSAGKGIAMCLPFVDDVIVFDVPWMKHGGNAKHETVDNIVKTIAEKCFDAAFVFTVFSQNPLPTAMITYMAGIPVRVGYCRENPYHLLTHWLPDKEPYAIIKHQVRRDLDMVASIGASVEDDHLMIQLRGNHFDRVNNLLASYGVDLGKPWIIFHPGVSERKRMYPEDHWVEAGELIIKQMGCQILLTGTKAERPLTDYIRSQLGESAFSLAGVFDLAEFITLIDQAPLVVSVNTGTIHLAAATKTPVVVLYALTNPQHAPWKVKGKVLPFSVDASLRSKNEVLRFVHEKYFTGTFSAVTPYHIAEAVNDLLNGASDNSLIPEIVSIPSCSEALQK